MWCRGRPAWAKMANRSHEVISTQLFSEQRFERTLLTHLPVCRKSTPTLSKRVYPETITAAIIIVVVFAVPNIVEKLVDDWVNVLKDVREFEVAWICGAV